MKIKGIIETDACIMSCMSVSRNVEHNLDREDEDFEFGPEDQSYLLD